MKKYLLILGLVLFSVGGFAQQENIAVVEPEMYKEYIKNGEDVQLIDVRTPEEFAEGHIEGAQNIDFKADDFLEQFSRIDKDRPVYIYCRSGKRSSDAAEQLSELGFPKIIDLKGGYLAWKKGIKE